MNATLSNCATDTQCTTDPHCYESDIRTEQLKTVRPKADVFQTDDAWLITLDLPGADEILAGDVESAQQ